jgi:hypothetical protein
MQEEQIREGEEAGRFENAEKEAENAVALSIIR